MSTPVGLKRYHKIIIASLVGVLFCALVWVKCDNPPYGYPHNESSDNYWGIIMDVAQKWRLFNFSFWDRELGGGVSLFTSGHYPLLNPTNAAAWVLNDDQFYLFKLLEPYFWGVFFCLLLLWDYFKVGFFLSVFGAVSYMGLPASKYTAMAQSPFFLFGCALFPGMVYFYLRYRDKYPLAAAGIVGSMVAWQFAGEGVTQIPQMIILWSIFFVIDKFPNIVLSARLIGIFLLMLVGLWAVQFIPSYFFFTLESSREAGHYPINNFSVFKVYPGNQNWVEVFWRGFILVGDIRLKIFPLTLLVALAIGIRHFGHAFKNVVSRDFVYKFWLALGIYFMIPPTAGVVTDIFPSLKPLASPLTYFCFRYAMHAFDLALILSMCLIFNQQHLVWTSNEWSLKRIASLALMSIVAIIALMPMIFFMMPNLVSSHDLFPYFTPVKLFSGFTVLAMVWFIIFYFTLRPGHVIFKVMLYFVLINVAFMEYKTSFKHSDKGQRTQFALFQWGSPEHDFYKKARGQYLQLFEPHDPLWMGHDYNLLYGVHGTAGFLPVPPKRLAMFLYYYEYRHQSDFQHKRFDESAGARFNLRYLQEPLATYMPIDYMVTRNDRELNWPSFTKNIVGDKYTIYKRIEPTQQVYFANQLKHIDFFDQIRMFDTPRTQSVYVTHEDAAKYQIPEVTYPSLSVQPSYWDYNREPNDNVSFKLVMPQQGFVVVPERFQSGWHVTIDGKPVSIFPAYYLYIGFQALPGGHDVKMRYIPPGLWIGIGVNVVALGCIVIFLIKRRRR